jgi:hypothetical protein
MTVYSGSHALWLAMEDASLPGSGNIAYEVLRNTAYS